MDDAPQDFINEGLEGAILQAVNEDGISPDTDLMEDDALHHIGERTFVNMMDTFENLHTFTHAQDAPIGDYMANTRGDYPTLRTNSYRACRIENLAPLTCPLSPWDTRP